MPSENTCIHLAARPFSYAAKAAIEMKRSGIEMGAAKAVEREEAKATTEMERSGIEVRCSIASELMRRKPRPR
ncbi:hypothetical protein [Merdimonas faecis]|uniref:hypothetical protein n=1 Tax=Merdimonas faecis TaxID=1653435 RepID=UPI0008636653|nr:hypothetical protein [Merdimonas faecis]